MTLLEIGQFKIALEIRHFKNEGRLSFRKEFWDRYLGRAIANRLLKQSHNTFRDNTDLILH